MHDIARYHSMHASILWYPDHMPGDIFNDHKGD